MGVVSSENNNNNIKVGATQHQMASKRNTIIEMEVQNELEEPSYESGDVIDTSSNVPFSQF